MINNTKIYILLFLLIFPILTYAVYFDVRIYTNVEIKNLNMSPLSGKYVIYDGDKEIAVLYKNSNLNMRMTGDDKIRVYKNDKDLGSYSNLSIKGEGFLNVFKVSLVNPKKIVRTYDDNLKVSVVNGNIMIINNVSLEHYVAGVVQSGGMGNYRDIEFYLIQAVTSRTYALVNFMKHKKQGYNQCDRVHCMAYDGRCKNRDIMSAVNETSGQVIVDADEKLISAAFHLNSGGQTVNSEDVWGIKTNYLKSVKDSFCYDMPNSTWLKILTKNKWLNYLSTRHNYPVNDSLKRQKALSFSQENRMVFFHDSIALKRIRNDLKLKSSFFSIECRNDTVFIKGKGYGHGVGLSQEGAVRMVAAGLNYKKILKFYYTNVRIVDFKKLRYLLRNFSN